MTPNCTWSTIKTVYILTGLDGIGVTPEVFLLDWSLDRLSDSFWVALDPTCLVIASLVVNLLFPLTFFPFDFFAKKSSNDLSLSDISTRKRPRQRAEERELLPKFLKLIEILLIFFELWGDACARNTSFHSLADTSNMAAAKEKMGRKTGCIFCSIAAKEQGTPIIYEDEKIAVFSDRRPAAKHHYLVIPKEHYGNPKTLTEDHVQLVERLQEVGKSVIGDTEEADPKDVLYGYHWPPFNSIQHLHLHVITPRSQMGFLARQIFKPNSFWFVSHEWLLERLKKSPSISSW